MHFLALSTFNYSCVSVDEICSVNRQYTCILLECYALALCERHTSHSKDKSAVKLNNDDKS